MQVRAGVETLTVTGAESGTLIEVRDAHSRLIVTLVADHLGNAHLAYVPSEPIILETAEQLASALAEGEVLEPGDYTVGEESVRVLSVGDLPDPSLYEQELAIGFGYLRVRDGVDLSILVRFPDEGLYGPGPYPTVIEYSGYSPSNPDAPQPGTLIGNLMGFAVVGVNMRGTGCSGGVFDVFSPAQAADGYDVVETVARQPWVLHNHVGMVGLSYPGISQLYVAATRPPSLAAIAPLSVIDDLWRQQWPGGIYNTGFTRAWLAARDEQSAAGGMAWDQERIDAGDEIARTNQLIRSQNFDFEQFGRAISNFRPIMGSRRTANLVGQIEVPVYLTGAWQDEQTGSRFALMLESFDSSPSQRFNLFNGHHPDGYSPMVILRWFEFLSFHVAMRIPVVPEIIRSFAPLQFEEVFGYNAELEADRFGHAEGNFDLALADYLAEPRVRILFESGSGHEVLGAPAHRFEIETDSFPPADVTPQRWYFNDRGILSDSAPNGEGSDSFTDDPSAGELAYSMELLDNLNEFTRPTVIIDWTRFSDEHFVAYQTMPLPEAKLIAGSGHVALWLVAGSADTAIQVTLTEIRSDGVEQRLQCGWHRPIHAVEDPDHSDTLRVDYTFLDCDRKSLEIGKWRGFRVPIHPLTHLLRAGSCLRVAVSTPGRDHPFWCFENPISEDAVHVVGRSSEHPSSLVLPIWDLQVDHPDDYPPAGSLRGQPTREALPIFNVSVS
ncbi:MAG: CocE/NonD family hydrolase [Microthrixaceae bacterium]